MESVQLLVSFSLKRESVESYQHRATVALDCDDVETLVEQLNDLQSEYSDLQVEGVKHH